MHFDNIVQYRISGILYIFGRGQKNNINQNKPHKTKHKKVFLREF